MKKKDILAVLSVTDDPMFLFKISNIYELEDLLPDIERTIRTSREYRVTVFWHKSKHSLSVDSIDNLDSYDYDKLTVDMHHYPLTLYDICYLVGSKMLADNPDKEFLTFDIASEVIREHFNDTIGIVPLLRSDHEKTHEGLLNLTPDMIHGDYTAFIDKYKDYITEPMMNNIKDKLML